jgi:hypothetical protein
MINWQKIPGINRCRVCGLGSTYMESFLITTDTFLILNKAVNPVLHYAISPLIVNVPMVRSYTFNYTQQGSGCFISTFLGNISPNNQINLQLYISTLLGIKSIVFEKRTVTDWSRIFLTNTINSLQYFFTDVNSNPGSNIYRAYVELNDGRKIYSEELLIYYKGAALVKLYPNPVQRNSTITILAKPEDELTLQLFNTNGKLVVQQLLNNFPENIPIKLSASRGLLLPCVTKKMQSGKLIIQ